ncbi:MAG TPA: aminopeptidase [Gaiellaceae bacterium]|nr:aminopeptidase [Gaiellaceae bacterium]
MSDHGQLAAQLADLVAGFGANIQPGQLVNVSSAPGKEAVTRELARAAYQRGAKFVDVTYFDQWLKRERLTHADESTLEYVPEWMGRRLLDLADEHGCRISLSGPHAPRALEGIDPARAGRDLLPYLKETGEIINRRTTNWCVAPAPNAGWATYVYPGLEPDEAFDRLWADVAHICRLDEADPVAAWTERMNAITAVADRLTERRFDAIRLHGPDTDLTIGLLPSSRWVAGGMGTVDGLWFHPNVPSEEIFTTPDPLRAEGYVTGTMPRELYGAIVDGFRLEFAGGRVTRVDAEVGAEALRGAIARDPNGSRLGELALVDGDGRIGPLRTVFFDTLLDENAASHIALGNGYATGVDDPADEERVNASAVHIDLMIGRPELMVDGVTGGGEHVPLLRSGAWQL